jgi:hypothetical protein
MESASTGEGGSARSAGWPTVLVCSVLGASACNVFHPEIIGVDGLLDAGGTRVDGGDTPDAAPGVTQVGRAVLLDVAFEALPDLGRGLFLDVSFHAKEDAVAPSYEEEPGSPFGCKVTELGPENFARSGLDQGEFSFAVSRGPDVPRCSFVAGRGYRCIGASGTGGSIEELLPGSGLFGLFDDATTFGADEIGRPLTITGSANPANDGEFLIIDFDGDHSILFLNPTPGASSEEATPATYFTAAGSGPNGVKEPVPDDAEVTFTLDARPDGHAEDFVVALDIGDSFALDGTSGDDISNIPVDGSAFAIGCTGEGGTCGAAAASILEVVASDGDATTFAPFLVPAPREKAVVIRCVVDAGVIAVDETASQYIQAIDPIRIRAVFARVNEQVLAQPRMEMSVLAGHAVGGITDFE